MTKVQLITLLQGDEATLSYPRAEFTAVDAPGVFAELLAMLLRIKLQQPVDGVLPQENDTVIVDGIAYRVVVDDNSAGLPVPNWPGVFLVEERNYA